MERGRGVRPETKLLLVAQGRLGRGARMGRRVAWRRRSSLDAPLVLVLLSADQYCLTTAIRSASGRPVACGAVKRRVNVGGLDRLLLGARLAALAAKSIAQAK